MSYITSIVNSYRNIKKSTYHNRFTYTCQIDYTADTRNNFTIVFFKEHVMPVKILIKIYNINVNNKLYKLINYCTTIISQHGSNPIPCLQSNLFSV